MNVASEELSYLTFCVIAIVPVLCGLMSNASSYGIGDRSDRNDTIAWLVLDEETSLSKKKFIDIVSQYPSQKKVKLLESLKKTHLSSEADSCDLLDRRKDIMSFLEEEMSDVEKNKLLKTYFKDCGYAQIDLPIHLKKIKRLLFATYMMTSFFHALSIACENSEAEYVFYQLSLIGPLLSFVDLSLFILNYSQSSLDHNFKMNVFLFFEMICLGLNLVSSTLNYNDYDISEITQVWGRGYTIGSLVFSYLAMSMHSQYEKEIHRMFAINDFN